MASVTVRAAGRSTVTAHRKVTIKAGTEVLTLPITDPEVTLGGFTPERVQIPRPGLRPLLRKGAESLKQMTFSVTFYDRGQSVEKGLQTLRRFATLGPLAVSYGASDSGMWWLLDAQVVSARRELGTNNITEARASLTFIEHFPEGIKAPTAPKPVPKPTAAAGAKRAVTPTPPKQRTYTVVKGDTLTKIAARMYGNGNRFGDIAKANKIKDPNKITVGQRLVIP